MIRKIRLSNGRLTLHPGIMIWVNLNLHYLRMLPYKWEFLPSSYLPMKKSVAFFNKLEISDRQTDRRTGEKVIRKAHCSFQRRWAKTVMFMNNLPFPNMILSYKQQSNNVIRKLNWLWSNSVKLKEMILYLEVTKQESFVFKFLKTSINF